jgi:hypothetical protein
MATQADGAPEQETGLGLLHRGLPRGILACFGRRLPHPWLRNLQIVVVPAGTQELTLSGQAHAFADQLAKLLELAGVGIIISSVLIATALFS